MIIIHACTFLQPLRSTHGPSIKLKPAARCCCPDSPRAARVSATASSKSASWSVVQTMTLAAGSAKLTRGHMASLPLWLWLAVGEKRGFMSGIFTTVPQPHAGSLWRVFRCLARRASQSAPTVLKPSNSEGVKRESTVSQHSHRTFLQVETLHVWNSMMSFVEMDLPGNGIGNIAIY